MMKKHFHLKLFLVLIYVFFSIEQLYAQTFHIINAYSGKCLTADDTEDNEAVTQRKCEEDNSLQVWQDGKVERISSDGTSAQQISSYDDEDYCLLPRSGQTTLIMFHCRNTEPAFSITSIDRGSKLGKIRVNRSTKCLDVPDASNADVRIQTFECHDGLNQQWLIVPITD